jgi:adenylate cyclase
MTEHSRFPDFVGRIMEYGTHGYPRQIRRRLVGLNAGALSVIVGILVFIVMYLIEDPWLYRWPLAVSALFVILVAAVPLLHRYNDWGGALFLALSSFLCLFWITSLVGAQSVIHLGLLTAGGVMFMVLGRERVIVTAMIAGLGLFLHMYAKQHYAVGSLGPDLDPVFLLKLYVLSALSTTMLMSTMVYHLTMLNSRAEDQYESLLRRTMPEQIASRLVDSPGEPIAESFDEATVLFSDLRGFVPLSRTLGPARTVEVLNDLVQGFDRLAARHGVERIKTIGDAYMAVCGVPVPVEGHATRMGRLALSMQLAADQTSKRYGIRLQMRIGIATGPVTAGIIGLQRFSYDVWGDAVNLAARLESHGQDGAIHTSERFREMTLETFEFIGRGLVDIKGIGPVPTWNLVSETEAARTVPLAT